MGHIKNEQVADGRGVHEWDNVVLSNEESVQALILNRSVFDEFFQAKLFETQDINTSNGIYEFVENIDIIYVDLDALISRTRLSENQLYIIKKLMYGYNFADIAEKNKCDIRSIKNLFKSACRTIVQRYNFEYAEWLEVSGTIKINDSDRYKTCSKCGEQLKLNDTNFYKEPKGKDGYKNICKNCMK